MKQITVKLYEQFWFIKVHLDGEDVRADIVIYYIISRLYEKTDQSSYF